MAVRLRLGVNGDERDAGLDESPREQHAGTEEVVAVAFAEFERFAVEVERRLRFGGQQQIERGIAADSVVQRVRESRLRFDLLNQRSPRVQGIERNVPFDLRQARLAGDLDVRVVEVLVFRDRV